jgi:hypothetical protein
VVKREVLISIDDDHREHVLSIAERLTSEGMAVRHALPALGTIAGTIDESRLKHVEAIEGVSTVEPAGEVRIAPPHSDLQ